MNDWMHDEENDRWHRDPIHSLDTDEEIFWDWVGDQMTNTHEARAVNVTLDWVTWAEEDIDFWSWFWQWYGTMDSVWTFDHEPGEVLMDPDYEYEWFQNHTAGHNETFDELKIDRDDSEQWNWETWDNFWNNEGAIDHSTTGFMSRSHDSGEELMHADEDDVCRPGAYVSDDNTCLPCPVGCAHC